MNIVVLDGHTLNPGDNPWTGVAALGSLTLHPRTPPDQLIERAAEADVLVTNKAPITAEHLAALPRLKFIAVTATGFNIVDIQAARARGVAVSNVPVYGTDTVAEFVFALLLNHCRHPQRHAIEVERGAWTACPDFSFWSTPQIELAGRTLGIVGFGRIGRRVGELAAAFRMRVLAHGPMHGEPPRFPFEVRSLEAVFAESDVVSLHCRLTPQNTGMVDAALLARMKPDAYLINTARGPLVDEVALARALNDGRIGGAAVDVLSVEPMRPDHPLRGARNLTITPHLAWATLSARRRLMEATVVNIAAFIAGTPIHVVN